MKMSASVILLNLLCALVSLRVDCAPSGAIEAAVKTQRNA
jgi:hypothetical protein